MYRINSINSLLYTEMYRYRKWTLMIMYNNQTDATEQRTIKLPTDRAQVRVYTERELNDLHTEGYALYTYNSITMFFVSFLS